MFSRAGGDEVKLIDFGLAKFMKQGIAYASKEMRFWGDAP